jgi:hypothetical protein
MVCGLLELGHSTLYYTLHYTLHYTLLCTLTPRRGMRTPHTDP